MADEITIEGDVLVVGGGGAGMFAAVAAARNGARVLLLDKNVVGRGGATIMAQMTCASALGEAEPDTPQLHLEDTLSAGRGLCNENLAALLCEGSPKRIRELAGWKVNWAKSDDGKINQVKAPGHSRKRCVYVDFLSTGAAICAALAQQDEPRCEHPPAEQRQRDRHRGSRWRGRGRGRARRADLHPGQDQMHRRDPLHRRDDQDVSTHDRVQQSGRGGRWACASRRCARHRYRVPAVLSERAPCSPDGRTRSDDVGADARQARRTVARRQRRRVPAPIRRSGRRVL